MSRYIAKPDTWFKEGTEAKFLGEMYRDDLGVVHGLFSGVRVCQNPGSEGMWHQLGEEYEDEEICSFEEFEEVIDE